MNLELIKKYEKEFLHMLHGGKVLMGKKDPVTNTIKWYPSVLNPFVETSESILIVVDDVYCTYRKALAEGRTLQYMNSNGEIKTLEEWDNIGWKQFKGCVENYRIKPEEPKFKGQLMKGSGSIIEDKETMRKAVIKAALQGVGVYIVDATRALEAQKYTPLYPEIKQHEQYGWYRKFDKRKFR